MSTTRINTFRAKDGMASNLCEFLISILPLIGHAGEPAQWCMLRNRSDRVPEPSDAVRVA